ncbi:MAG: Xaa-Pro peptidase family protein [Pseudomonadota bacterium]
MTFSGTTPIPLVRKMAKQQSPFSQDEYLSRIQAVKAKMDENAVDCFLVNEGGNICYLSGYAAESDYVAQGLILYGDETFPSLVLRKQDGPAGMFTSFMPNEYVIDYPEEYIGSYTSSGFDFMLERITSQKKMKRIGLEFDSISAATLASLQRRHPNIEFVDMSGTIIWIRIVKSPAEIQVQREAMAITDRAFMEMPKLFRIGRRENEVAADITAHLIAGTPELAGSVPDTVLIPGGNLSGTSHVPWTDREIVAGRHYNPEYGASRYSYSVGLMRSLSMGKPSDRLADLYKYMIEGCNEALSVFKPGTPCSAVAQRYCAVLNKGGYSKDSRCGYPIGINWLEDSCSLRVDDPTIMQENMVFHLMLGTWIDEDFGAVISETIALTKDGCEVLSNVPRELMIVD